MPSYWRQASNALYDVIKSYFDTPLIVSQSMSNQTIRTQHPTGLMRGFAVRSLFWLRVKAISISRKVDKLRVSCRNYYIESLKMTCAQRNILSALVSAFSNRSFGFPGYTIRPLQRHVVSQAELNLRSKFCRYKR